MEADHGSDRVYEFAGKGPGSSEAAMVTLARLLAPLGIERGGTEAGGGADLGVLHEAGVAVLGLHQDSSRYFDVHHTADDTLDKIDPVALRQVVAAYAVAAWVGSRNRAWALRRRYWIGRRSMNAATKSTGTLLLTASEVAALLDLPACIAAVEDVLRRHVAGETVPPRVLGLPAAAGALHVKGAGLLGSEPRLVVKLNANFPANPERFQLPTIQGVLALFDGACGRPSRLFSIR